MVIEQIAKNRLLDGLDLVEAPDGLGAWRFLQRLVGPIAGFIGNREHGRE